MKKIVNITDGYTVDSGFDYSFLNFFSIGELLQDRYKSENILYMCDGFLMSLLMSVIFLRNVVRKSFDYSSIACEVFNQATLDGKSVYIVGGTEEQIKIFIERLTVRFVGINISGWSNGYLTSNEWNLVAGDIVKSKTDIVVAGMGAGLQEKFILNLRSLGYKGVSFTCGGFISQTASSEKEFYYPKLIDNLNLRFLYRMYMEPHTVKRYFIDYPINLFSILYAIFRRRVFFKYVC